MSKLGKVLFVFAAASMWSSSVSADDVVARAASTQSSQCGVRAQVIGELASVYREAPSAIGQISQDLVIEVYRSSTGAFTIISTDRSGQSCVVAIGENWQDSVTLAGAES